LKVYVYVEGPSDQLALQRLLSSVVKDGKSHGVGIHFFPLNGKAELLKKCGMKAAGAIKEDPNSWVFALPDLHPLETRGQFQHRSFPELEEKLQKDFEIHADKIKLDKKVRSHFRVHCLKHDLEALLLAVPEILQQRLGMKSELKESWTLPVENQNGDKPPKRIVEELFVKHKKERYRETLDAPWILEKASLATVLGRCKERFAPFVEQLQGLAEGKPLT